MKKIITAILIGIMLHITDCMAQNGSGRFYTIGKADGYAVLPDCKKNSNVNEASEDLDVAAISEHADFEKPDSSMGKQESLVGEYKQRLSLRDSLLFCKATENKGKIHSYYPWKPRELTLKNLVDVLAEVGLSNKLFVLSQALLETGYFSSRVCKKYNNLFGLYDSKNRDYYRFARWEDSVVGYMRMIQYRYKGGNYLHFLKRIGYAEDPRYISKVAKIAKSLYNNIVSE